MVVIGQWPWSFDEMDILRVLPEIAVSSIVPSLLVKDRKKATLAGGALGAATGALARGQIAIEMYLYPTEFAEGVITPEMWNHQLFIACLDSVVAAAASAALTFLIKTVT